MMLSFPVEGEKYPLVHRNDERLGTLTVGGYPNRFVLMNQTPLSISVQVLVLACSMGII